MINFKEFLDLQEKLLLEGGMAKSDSGLSPEGKNGIESAPIKRYLEFTFRSRKVTYGIRLVRNSLPNFTDSLVLQTKDGSETRLYIQLEQNPENYDYNFPKYFFIASSNADGPSPESKGPNGLISWMQDEDRKYDKDSYPEMRNVTNIVIRDVKDEYKLSSEACKPANLGITGEKMEISRFISQLKSHVMSHREFSPEQQDVVLEMIDACYNTRTKDVSLNSSPHPSAEAIYSKMKDLGEVLGPIALAGSNDLYSPWGDSYNGPISVYIPTQSNYPLIDFMMYTQGESGAEVEWQFSSKMKTGGNTVKGQDLEKIFNEQEVDGPLEIMNENALSTRYDWYKSNYPYIWEAMEWVRYILKEAREGDVVMGQINAASKLYAKDGKESAWIPEKQLLLPAAVTEATLLEPNYNSFDPTGNVFADMLSLTPEIKNKGRRDVDDVFISTVGNTTNGLIYMAPRLAPYSNTINGDESQISLRQLFLAAGNYISHSSKNDPKFKIGTRAWFEFIITNRVYYMICNMDKRNHKIGWENKGAGEAEIPKFSDIYLRPKDTSNAIGFHLKS